ncbi:MAG TPA: serine/threonine-protein kinase [Polyangiaceae bacterium]|jgi:serine/threonine-protein kinase|nr:serine/threonine-protein kinase [Polyangiaceae bacterium]
MAQTEAPHRAQSGEGPDAPEKANGNSEPATSDPGLPSLEPVTAAKVGRGFESAWTDPPPAGADEDPLLGITLSRTYHVTRVLGEGGMGRVYEAWHTRIKKKRYAIKVLHPEFARSPEVLTRFQREAEAAACFSHPNAVGVYDVALTPQGWPYLVCDYLEGLDFSEHIKRAAPLNPAVVKHIGLQVCDALVDAHNNGVIHRDLKPQNVFLVGNFADGVPLRPNAKVLDFGLSRFLDSGDSELTKTGVIMGTPSYMAPEQARGERVDHRCDVYGVGALLYAALTGRPPFKTETPQATILAVMNEEPPRPRTLNPRVPVGFEVVIQRAMAKDPSQRYPDMRSLRQALLELDLGERGSIADDDAGSEPTQMLQLQRRALDDAGMHGARLMFLIYAALSLLALFAGLTTAIVGAVVLSVGQWPFSRIETLLLLFAVVGTLLTPSLLLVRRLRKTVWDNTARVVMILHQMREAVTVGLFAYGVGALSWLFLDNVLVHFVEAPGLTSDAGLRWPGTPIVLLAAALWISAASLARIQLTQLGGWVDRSTSDAKRRMRQFLTGPLLTFVSGIGVIGFLGLGAIWRSIQITEPALKSEPTLSSDAHAAGTDEHDAPAVAAASNQVPAGATPEAENTSTAPVASSEPPRDLALATSDELSAAISQGLDGLKQLQTRYPTDPKVLRALAMSQASRSSGLSDAAMTLQRLFTLSPQSTNDTDLQYMVMQMARTQGDASRRALKLLTSSMGNVGPDLLYKLSLSHGDQRDPALKALASGDARKHFSPALAIAYELQYAESCSARLPLLPRAQQLGDERAIRILTPLATDKPKGCGPKKNLPCKATCTKQAAEYLKTVDVIAARLRAHN